MIDVRLLKVARAALGWSQAHLAEKAGISPNALARLEAEQASPRIKTLQILQKVLEEGGIKFLPETETDGEGLRIPKRRT